MLRREPTSVTLETKDIEIFKELVKKQQLKKDNEHKTTTTSAKEKDHLDDRNDIFMGRSILRTDRKRDLQSRLGLEEEEEEEEDIEGPLFKKTHL